VRGLVLCGRSDTGECGLSKDTNSLGEYLGRGSEMSNERLGEGAVRGVMGSVESVTEGLRGVEERVCRVSDGVCSVSDEGLCGVCDGGFESAMGNLWW
jgi:hypothetical protein